MQVLTSLVQTYQARGDWAKAIHYAQRALLIDALHERFQQVLMTCYYLTGDRGAALAQYATCERLLREQLGVDPDDSTRELRDAIAAGTLPRSVLSQPTRQLRESLTVMAPPEEPLFGREHELARVRSALTSGAGRAGRNVLIHGEVGRGKSRLVRELLRRLAPHSFATVIQIHCRAAWMSQPLWPILEALRLAASPVEQGASRGHLLQALEERLCALPGPVLLVVEDVHWADDDTGRVLDYLLHNRAAHHITVVLTSRDWELSPNRYLLLRRWEAEGHLTWIDLPPLQRDDFADLVRSRLADAGSSFIDLLEEETGENPLFALSILEAIDSAEPTAVPASPNQLPMPPYLCSLVEARMRGLSPEAVQLAKVAALTREGVSLRQLELVTGLGIGRILDGLDELLTTRFVREDPDSDRIRVLPGFVRRAIVSTLSQSRRRYLLSMLGSSGNLCPPVRLQ